MLVLVLGEQDYIGKLKNYFENNFDEDEHQQHKIFFTRIVGLFSEIKESKELLNEQNVVELILDEVYAILRLVKFINQKDDHD